MVAYQRVWREPDTDIRTTILLGYTSNLISSGLRETLRYLVQHKHVAAIVTTAGGIEEDLIKCLAPTYIGSFSTPGADLRAKGMNRIGNLIVPNSNYCAFEDWLIPILDQMLSEQEGSRATDNPLVWSPSTIIQRLGKEINDKSSVYYWAYRNNIPVFCPALTDGSLGDMLYFHTFKTSPQVLDISITRDIRRINDIAMHAKRVGMIILGGGIVKHHIANACLMRNGAESAVYINTAQEFDGSDAGARPDEAVSWGKIKADGDSVKVRLSDFAIDSNTFNHSGLRRGYVGVSNDRCLHICATRREDHPPELTEYFAQQLKVEVGICELSTWGSCISLTRRDL